MENWLRPLRKGDMEVLLNNMRPSDLQELESAFPQGNILGHLNMSSVAAKKIVVWECPEGLVAVIGCTPKSWQDDTVGSPWVLSTPLIETRWRVVMKHAPAILDWFHEDFALLMNVKRVDYHSHKRWLRRLGFHFFGTPRRGFQSFAHIRKEKT